VTVVKRLVLILGDQLDLQSSVLRDFDRKTDEIIMVESSNEAQYVWTHKAKIALFLSAMRHFAQKLRELKYPLIYIQESSLPMIDVLRQEMLSKKVTHLVCIEPGEWRIRQSIEALALELKVDLQIREDEHFYCTPQEFKDWVADKKEIRLEYFYRLMRKRHNILLDGDGNPEGGQWNFDQDNRKPYPKKGPGMMDPPAAFAVDDITKEVLDYVGSTYQDHPGSLSDFNWPVTREQALEALECFVEYRLRNFGTYQDAMWTDTPFGWHSILSCLANTLYCL
jgi:deoxyribodipyrimidine photolyase-related protein